MTIRVTLTRRNLFIIGVAVCLIVAGLVFLVRHLQGQTQVKYYSKQLELLKGDISAIDSLNKREDLKDSPTDQFDLYQVKLADIVDVCGQVTANADKTRDDPKNKPIAEQTKQISTLCNDLVTVTVYAQKQADATRNFVLFPADSLSEQKNIAGFEATLRATKASLEGLKQDPMNDPAIPEQITLLERLRQQAGDNGGQPIDLSSLARQTIVHQANFLNARTYYWTNTIGIEDLSNTIDALKIAFNAKK